jgi:hypothetical protein
MNLVGMAGNNPMAMIINKNVNVNPNQPGGRTVMAFDGKQQDLLGIGIIKRGGDQNRPGN